MRHGNCTHHGVSLQTILVVEDSAAIRQMWQRVLTGAGYRVLQASDGAEAVHQAREHTPDLILMDVTLPVLDGISAVRALKADRTTAHLPVIFVSGDLLASRRARTAGARAFLAKPVRPTDLLDAIAGTLAASESRRERYLREPLDQAADKRRS